MSNVPENLFYSDTDEWIRVEKEGVVTVGVTDYAQSAMGDMVYVELPKVGEKLKEKDECGVLESVKSASDLYSPVDGVVVAVNEDLVDSPDLVNKEVYGKGWLMKVKLDDPESVKKLMNASSYQEYLQSKE